MEKKNMFIKTGEIHSNSLPKAIQKSNIETINKLLSSNISLFKTRTNYELMYEAFYISNLFYEMTKTKYHQKDSFFYVLSLEWFSKWKKYVNYDFYTSNINYQKFKLLNSLPFRPNSPEQDNYMKNIRPNTKRKIVDFFDKFFLGNNENFYPGYINNKKFLVENNQNVTYLYKTHLENNFNMKNEFKYNEHYIWVTEDIWKYFYCVYGGFEIRRRNLFDNNNDYYLIKDESINPEINIILEPKFKIYNLILFHFSKNYTYRIDPPKYFFISHCATILELKKNIKNLFQNLNGFRLDEIHLFYLEQNMNINTFANYMKNNINYKYEKKAFPGISLDSFNSNMTLEHIEENYLKVDMNNVSTIILEIPFIFREYNNKKIFFFENQSGTKLYNDIEINNEYNKPYYDKIKFDENEENNNFIINDKLFLIKKFFYGKYFLDKINQCQKSELNIHLKKIIDNFNNEQIKKIFEVEIDELRNNLDLIFDKTYLANNISNLYLSEFNRNENSSDNSIFLNKKREREKESDIIIDSEDENENDISWYTCGYCKKALNQNCLVCRFCKRKKYCNYICRTYDIKKHLLSCGK